MMAGTILDPEDPAFDEVTVLRNGEVQVYSFREFMSFPLAERIEMILRGQPEFRLAGEIVDKKKAISLG